MHRAAEDSSQDFVEPAEDQGDGSIPPAAAPTYSTANSNDTFSVNMDVEHR